MSIHDISFSCDCSSKEIKQLTCEIESLKSQIDKLKLQEASLEKSFMCLRSEIHEQVRFLKQHSSMWSSLRSWLESKGIIKSFEDY